MISRPALTRGAHACLRRHGQLVIGRRAFASPAADSDGSFQPTEIAGVKIASKDSRGPTTKLAIVARAGTRYQPAPGLAVGLEEFAFKVRWEALMFRVDYLELVAN
jgi:ubiquinol-cytochrome c reductase core subunit 2